MQCVPTSSVRNGELFRQTATGRQETAALAGIADGIWHKAGIVSLTAKFDNELKQI